MAEIRNVILPGDATITIEDGTGTPLTYAVVVQGGGFTLMDGEYEHVYPQDANGRPLSGATPRAAGIRSLCGFRFSGTVWDAGDNSTDATLADIIRWDGVVASTPWVSTLVDPDDLIHTVNVRVVWKDRGSVKGATWLYPNCRIESAFEPTAGADGLKCDLTFRSLTAVRPTVTRTT